MKYQKIVILIILSIVLGILINWYLYKDLPYGRLNPKSELCKQPELTSDPDLCRKSGCIFGNGDLTGPPFCGAYKE